MKKIHLASILLLLSAITKAQPIVFADANFKARLLLASTVSGVAYNGWNGSYATSPTAIDTNNDGEIQPNEAAVITKLDLSSSNISNLSGIEYFANLREVDMINNSITSFSNTGMDNLVVLGWDHNPSINSISINLSGFPNLKWASLTNNNFNSITLNNMPLLETLSVSYNPITTMDFSGLPSLKTVTCGATLVTTLDFMNNPLFERLYFGNNPNLTTLKIKNGTMQNFIHPEVSSLPMPCSSNFPSLSYICADANEIAGMQNFMSRCGVTQAITYNSSCVLGVDDFESSSFIVYPNPSKGLFNISFNDALNENLIIEIFNLLGQNVYKETVINQKELKISLTHLPKGTYIVKVANNDDKYITKIIIE